MDRQAGSISAHNGYIPTCAYELYIHKPSRNWHISTEISLSDFSIGSFFQLLPVQKSSGFLQPETQPIFKIVAAFRGMHVSPVKQSSMRDYQDNVTTGQTHGQTDKQTDARQSDQYVTLYFAGDTIMGISH